MKKPAKGDKSEILPSRTAMTRIVKGDTYQRSINNYAKKAPSINTSMPSIFSMGRL